MGRTMNACIEERRLLSDKDPDRGYGPWRFLRYFDYTDRHDGMYDELHALCTLAVARLLDIDPATRDRIDPDGEHDWQTLDDDTGVRVVSAERYLEALGTFLAGEENDLCRSKQLLDIGAEMMRVIARPVTREARVIVWYDDAPFVGIAARLRERLRHRPARDIARMARRMVGAPCTEPRVVPLDENGQPDFLNPVFSPLVTGPTR